MIEVVEFQVNFTFTFIGDPDGEIKLKLVYPNSAKDYFFLEGKSLRLKQPIDRDAEDLSQISLQVTKV